MNNIKRLISIVWVSFVAVFTVKAYERVKLWPELQKGNFVMVLNCEAEDFSKCYILGYPKQKQKIMVMNCQNSSIWGEVDCKRKK